MIRAWMARLCKPPDSAGDDVAARAWFDEHIVHRIDSADNEEAAQDPLVERLRTICIDAAQMYPDREGAIRSSIPGA